MARVVNEKRFGESTCTCYEIDQSKEPTPENLLCYKPGGIGVLSNKQDRECIDMIILPTPPSLEFHLQKFEIAGKEILADCMKYDNEEEFRACLKKQTEKRGLTYVTKREQLAEPVEIPKKKETPKPKKEEKPVTQKGPIFDEKGKLIIPMEKKTVTQKTVIPSIEKKVTKKPVKTIVEKPVKKGTLDERLKASPGRVSINEFVKENPDFKKPDVEKTITGYIAIGAATAIDDDVVYIH